MSYNIFVILFGNFLLSGTSAKNTFEVYCSLMAADGNWHSFIKGLEGEKLHETYRKLWLYTNLPNFMRPSLAGLQSKTSFINVYSLFVGLNLTTNPNC